MMKTEHHIRIGNAKDMADVPTDSVELVVTSPPYPMIEMWDDLFAELNHDVACCLEAGDGPDAFELMHAELAKVWDEIDRVLVNEGIACINIGDATRKIDGSFRVYQNHAKIIEAFTARGFAPLPDILWRKPVNSAAKFMGSGMLPPNAYVTLEHEYILIFRAGDSPRAFEPQSDRRYRSAYFWEERNRWFSDVWSDIQGELQSLAHRELRDRSGAFPFEIPYRLISMYSVYGDTVLDPFWGTGTTSLAAMVAGRNSIGYELDEQFAAMFYERVHEVPEVSRSVVRQRLADHESFVRAQQDDGDEYAYLSRHYGIPVRSRQARDIMFYTVEGLEESAGDYIATYRPFDGGTDSQNGSDTER